MRLDRLKSFALALPQTTVVAQWGGLVFMVAEKRLGKRTVDEFFDRQR